jgi:2-phosphosulfolactate phosphatase
MLPSQIPQGALSGNVAVVLDVLRATTVMVHALAAGCLAVIPCVSIEEARETAGKLPRGAALLCGERGGRPIEGFDLGNSPDEFTPAACRDRILVMTTTNGTRAIAAASEAREVLVAGFVNLAATANWLRDDRLRIPGLDVHIVCAGTDGAVSYEDTLAAAALTRLLVKGPAPRFEPANDAARLCLDLPPAEIERLPEKMRLGSGGRNVMNLGLARDIAAAARVDRFSLAAGLDRRQTPNRIVRLTG